MPNSPSISGLFGSSASVRSARAHELRIAGVVLVARQRGVRQDVRAVQRERRAHGCPRAAERGAAVGGARVVHVLVDVQHREAGPCMRELRLPRDETLEARDRFGKQRRVRRAAESAVTRLAVRQLERVRGAARERELRVEHWAEQRGRGRGVARDLGLQLRLLLDARRLVVGRGPDLRSGLGLDDPHRDARAAARDRARCRSGRSCARRRARRRALCPADATRLAWR